jgi:hypothetical protein
VKFERTDAERRQDAIDIGRELRDRRTIAAPVLEDGPVEDDSPSLRAFTALEPIEQRSAVLERVPLDFATHQIRQHGPEVLPFFRAEFRRPPDGGAGVWAASDPRPRETRVRPWRAVPQLTAWGTAA